MRDIMATVSFVGHIGKAPESRKTASGVSVINFSVAENDFRNGEQHTNWFEVIAFNGFADSLATRLTKGSQVFVSGNLRVEDFTRQDGSKGRAVRVVADRVQTIGKRESNGNDQAVDSLAPRPRQQAPASDSTDLPF
jgi:single-strand DNA-binding protein